MYLAGFSIEEKYLFRELSIYAAKADGKFLDMEKLVIDTHCNEMGIDNNNYENDMILDDVLNKIKDSFSVDKLKMAYLEVMAVILADDVLESEEELFIENISKKFYVNENDKVIAIDALSTLKMAYGKMSDFIKGGTQYEK